MALGNGWRRGGGGVHVFGMRCRFWYIEILFVVNVPWIVVDLMFTFVERGRASLESALNCSTFECEWPPNY